ncbi:MAG: hypothetical protein ACTFAK_11815 [Candidatus Electronema sp. VV]
MTGAIALLWSAIPQATAAQIKFAVTHHSTMRRASVVPPLLDTEAAYQMLNGFIAERRRRGNNVLFGGDFQFSTKINKKGGNYVDE